MTIGELIKERRLQLGMTQEELANKTEISIRTIQRIENDEVDPRAYTLQVIAKALDIDFSVFTKNGSDEDKNLENNKRNWLALIHLSGLLPLFFPTIIIWNRKKVDIKEITDHYRSVISFQSINLFAILCGLWVFYWTKRPFVILIILLLGGFHAIRNTLKVLNGKPYKYYNLFYFKDKKQK
ncbi:MAG: helix-turn-helix domain-containing protein [Bacteroidales bacterium]|nr:helix-turn-helix domain-containing protein [Bacteroidales bacterium]